MRMKWAAARDQERYSKFSAASCCTVVHTFCTCIPIGSCRHYLEQLEWRTWRPTSCIHNSNMPRGREPNFHNFQQVALNCRHQNGCHHNDPSENHGI
ncbi:hypothetical protein K443DRAFT_517084 [Laccaria amethystina LaAM-08-1]|uniref:Uncharacterized protein n=1 Tax=Laccaria amethystina LaAM-08-1 TaxID=1095629 RepID=A0A0C9Y2Y1_9AGAR|nr:hypothetical protein K443DRAFT_517084 [Laccaria amethystina LaAM-08-1]